MITHPIDINVTTTYLAEHSEPKKQRFVFTYTITIKNLSELPTKLLSRHWIITDANDVVQEVQGEGVIGEQPRIEPGAEFTYSSGVVLETGAGTMEGSYQMRNDDGELFDAPIPTFALTRPASLH